MDVLLPQFHAGDFSFKIVSRQKMTALEIDGINHGGIRNFLVRDLYWCGGRHIFGLVVGTKPPPAPRYDQV